MPRNKSVVIAYHEAGHAVMAMACGFTVTEITVIPNDEGSGYVSWLEPALHTTDSRIKSVLVTAAGLAADYIHGAKNGTDEEVLVGHLDDQRRAAVHLVELGHGGCFLIYTQIAIRFLSRPDLWECIESFYDLISKAGTVNGRDFLYDASQYIPKITNDELDFLMVAVDRFKRGLL